MGVVAGACGSSNNNESLPDFAVPTDLSAAPADMADPSCPVGTKLNVGPASAFMVDKVKSFACAHLFVLRDAGGIYAMTSICTHEGCDVKFAPNTHDFECPCHLSVFDFNGAVTQTPAKLPLIHYACSLDQDGNVIVDLGMSNIDPSTRLAIQD
jgi:Rieske Fe-S protein